MNVDVLRGETLPGDGVVVEREGLRSKNESTRYERKPRCDDVDVICCFHLYKRIKDKYPDIHFNWMIAYWMMEGYLGHVDSVDSAYRKGHDIFMDFTYKEKPTAKAYKEDRETYWRHRFSVTRYMNQLGLVYVLDAAEMKEFGELVQQNGMLTTLKHHGRQWIRKSLLLDGSQLHRQVERYISEDLKYFVYFNPMPNFLQLTLNIPSLNLAVLVLRGCAFLEEIEESIREMTSLTILEISGPSPIKKIPDIFTKLTNLRSLNLSDLSIEDLPMSFHKLRKLDRLLLRGCSRLTKLPSVRYMIELKVIDLYGATSLTNLTNTKLDNTPLQMLDLSHTGIRRIPRLFGGQLTHLFLRNCCQISVFDIVKWFPRLWVLDLSGAKLLKRIETLKSLSNLIVLDLSHTSLDSLPEDGLRNLCKLEELNLSSTYITSLPPISHLSRLRRLMLHGCESLEKLKMKGLVRLLILDASGCKKLHKLRKLRHLKKLMALNLSGCSSLKTIKYIPTQFFPSLRSLILSGTNIETLRSYQQLQLHFLHHFKDLKILSLSGMSLKQIPSISHLKSLKQLSLVDCSELISVPDLKELTELQVLELSRTNISQEFLHNTPSSLHELLLEDCPRIEGSLPLESLVHLQELNLRGTRVSEFPYDIVRMNRLEYLRLPRTIDITRVDWSRIKDFLPKEIFWDQPINIFESVNVVISKRMENSMSAKPSNDNHLFRLVDNQHSWEAYFKQFHFTVPSQDFTLHINGVELVFKGHHPLARKAPYINPQGSFVEIHGFDRFPDETRIAVTKAVNVALVGNTFISSLSDECFQFMKAMEVCWINSCTNMKFVLGGQNKINAVLQTLVLSNLSNLKEFSAENAESRIIQTLKHMYVDCCSAITKIISPSHLLWSLETLQIKFCDKLEILCGGNASEYQLPKLRDLSLIDLPQLLHINVHLPSLQSLKIRHCPKLDILELNSILQCAQSQLTHLSLDSCPQLKHVFGSSMFPENIQELELRSCDELTFVFDSADPSSSTSSPSLCNLRRLQLWNLPKLKSIGGSFPSLEASEVKYCSRLPRNLWPQVKTCNTIS